MDIEHVHKICRRRSACGYGNVEHSIGIAVRIGFLIEGWSDCGTAGGVEVSSGKVSRKKLVCGGCCIRRGLVDGIGQVDRAACSKCRGIDSRAEPRLDNVDSADIHGQTDTSHSED